MAEIVARGKVGYDRHNTPNLDWRYGKYYFTIGKTDIEFILGPHVGKTIVISLEAEEKESTND